MPTINAYKCFANSLNFVCRLRSYTDNTDKLIMPNCDNTDKLLMLIVDSRPLSVEESGVKRKRPGRYTVHQQCTAPFSNMGFERTEA